MVIYERGAAISNVHNVNWYIIRWVSSPKNENFILDSPTAVIVPVNWEYDYVTIENLMVSILWIFRPGNSQIVSCSDPLARG